MSSLLHSVLSSSVPTSDADLAQPMASRSTDATRAAIDEWESVESPGPGSDRVSDDGASLVDTDDEMVAVATAPGTVAGTPLNLSRPGSPGMGTGKEERKRSGLAGAASPSGTSTPRRSAGRRVKAEKSRSDPLARFPTEVSQRIFLELPISTLANASAVNKRWRRSATLNHVWYIHVKSAVEDPTSAVTSTNANTFAAAQALISRTQWTRREARTDWKGEYRKERAKERFEERREGGEGILGSLGVGSRSGTPSRTERLRMEGVETPGMYRERQWKEEEGRQESMSKNEMREIYKSMPNPKLKGAKRGGVTGVRDKGGLGDTGEGFMGEGVDWD